MRHYYLTRSGRLRRKDHTLLFELSGDDNLTVDESAAAPDEAADIESAADIGGGLGADELGELLLSETEETDLTAELSDLKTSTKKPLPKLRCG